MSTTTIDDQLAEVRRRIVRLQALAQAGLVAERARIQRHLDALHQEEASVLAAVRGAPDEVEEKLGQLRTRLAVAENSLAADVSDEWTTFRGRRRGRAPQLGHLPRAAAGDGRGEGREWARAGRGGDRRRPYPADRRLRPPRAGARRTSTVPGTSRGTTSARLGTSSNGRPTNCRPTSTEREAGHEPGSANDRPGPGDRARRYVRRNPDAPSRRRQAPARVAAAAP